MQWLTDKPIQRIGFILKTKARLFIINDLNSVNLNKTPTVTVVAAVKFVYFNKLIVQQVRNIDYYDKEG